MAAAALIVVALGLLSAFSNQASCDGPCPARPTGPDGSLVDDHSYFLHRDLGRSGSITVRMTSMTGTITYPPPNHDRIVPGLVPWAKAGIIIKDGVRQGSSYAALMLTGSHGVRMQDDYRHDIAGNAGGVTPGSPRWLRLTRTGDTITGYESLDGARWTRVGGTHLSGLPRTVQVGLFATSPGDLTLRRVGLGGATEEVRFTQASGVFDHVGLKGTDSARGWKGSAVGEMNHTDWEKYHKASGAVVKGGTITVTGTGDIGPGNAESGARPLEGGLGGLSLALLVVFVVAARYAVPDRGDESPVTRRVLAAKAVVVGTVTFLTGLLALGIVIPVGAAVLRGNGIPVIAVSAFTEVRVVVGTAAVLALAAVLDLALACLLKRAWLAILVAVLVIAVPYAVTSLPCFRTACPSGCSASPRLPASPLSRPSSPTRRSPPTTLPQPDTSRFRGGPASPYWVRTLRSSWGCVCAVSEWAMNGPGPPLSRGCRPPVREVDEVHVVTVLLGDERVELRFAAADRGQLFEVAEALDAGAEHDEHVGHLAARGPEDVEQARRYDDQPALAHRREIVAQAEEHRSAQHVEDFVRELMAVWRRAVSTGRQTESAGADRAPVGEQFERAVGQRSSGRLAGLHDQRSGPGFHGDSLDRGLPRESGTGEPAPVCRRSGGAGRRKSTGSATSASP